MTRGPVGFVGFVGVRLTRIQKSVTYYSACRDTSRNLSRKEPTNPTKPTIPDHRGAHRGGCKAPLPREITQVGLRPLWSIYP
jgi:hypothetical protein